MVNEDKIKNKLLILFVIFRVIIIVLIVFYFTGITYHLITNSYVYEENGIRYCIYKESQTADVIKSPKANGKVVVPSYVIRKNKKYTVSTIKQNAFLDNKNIVELVFSEGIKKIEEESLSTNITKISIPNSIESFQVRNINPENIITFNNCQYLGNDENPYVVLVKADSNIVTTIIPDGLKVIGPYAFYECGSLTSIVLPDSVTSIERYAFTRCTSLNNLDISEDSYLEHIGEESLVGCVNLKSLFIPKNCTDTDIVLYSYLGNNDRFYVSKLEKIVVHNENPIYDSREDCNAVIETKTNELVLGCKNTFIPSSIKKLGSKCFSGVLFNNTELVLPNTIKEVGSYAFSMTNITKIVLNEICEKLGGGAFSICSNLEELIINKSIKEIGRGICEGDTKLKKLVIPFIGEKFSSKGQLSYFFGLSKKSAFTNLSVYIRPEKKYVIYKNSIDMSLNEIYFLENVYEIKSKAFNIQKINNIYISTNVTKVGRNIMNNYSVSNSTIYIEALNLGKSWNINWNNIKNSKLEYGYSFEQIYQELEVQNEE